MTWQEKEKRFALTVGAVFLILFVALVYSGRMPYVPLASLFVSIFPAASLFFFVVFFLLFYKHQGTRSQPRGLRHFRMLNRREKTGFVLSALVTLPLLGYMTYLFVATLPALPTRLLVENLYTVEAHCIYTDRNKYEGNWSMFKLNSGEEWKLKGYGQICPQQKRHCFLNYKKGALGYFITEVRCESRV